jgi:hypothetical protein
LVGLAGASDVEDTIDDTIEIIDTVNDVIDAVDIAIDSADIVQRQLEDPDNSTLLAENLVEITKNIAKPVIGDIDEPDDVAEHISNVVVGAVHYELFMMLLAIFLPPILTVLGWLGLT